MSTDWQPITWIFFHSIALEYNDQYKDHYKNFFETFKIIIPCKMCRTHFNECIEKEIHNLENNINQENIFNWTIDLHNNVNKMNKKKIWSYDEAREFYSKNKINNRIFKIFLYSYIRTNFRKNFKKTTELIRMIKCIPYIYHDLDKKKKLIDFSEKFDLTRESFTKWIFAFMIILKS
jgi:hypothetical protein